MSLSNGEYFAEWVIIREELVLLIRNKGPEKILLMRQGIHHLTFILDELAEAAPLNYMERLTFIESNIESYVAFIQLDELFKESKKKLARIRAQKKASES